MNELQARGLIQKAIEADIAYRKAYVSAYKGEPRYKGVVNTMTAQLETEEQLLCELGQVPYLAKFVGMLTRLKSHYHDECKQSDDRAYKKRAVGHVLMLGNLLDKASVFVAAIDE